VAEARDLMSRGVLMVATVMDGGCCTAVVSSLKAPTTINFSVHGIALLGSSLYVLREGFRLGRRSTEIAVLDSTTLTYDRFARV